MSAGEDDPVREGELLFEPSAERQAASQLSAFMDWLAEGGRPRRRFTTYQALWEWSTTDLAGFWSALAEWADVPFAEPPTEIVRGGGGGDGAEGARFFVGAELNYVDLVARHPGEKTAVVATDEAGNRTELSYAALCDLAGAAAAGLRRAGVRKGDRVAAVLPNGIAAIASFLATASLGAVWSSCAPEFGAPSMIDRFQQIAPTVLIAAESYAYGGKEFDLHDKIAALGSALDSAVVTTFGDLTSVAGTLQPVPVGFDHPLWILYSSGTTGLPKAIVHGHGGIVLEHLKSMLLQSDVGPADCIFWFTTTGWMMWNFVIGGLLVGATVVAYDGSPAHPDLMRLFELAAAERVTYFGTSAPFIETCRRAHLTPRTTNDLSAVRSIGSTGAPLSPEGFAWATAALGDDVQVGSVSGGTDVCTAFLAASPLLPVYAGELQCAALGTIVEAYGPDGRAVADGEVGELVVTTPLPSMPVAFWDDADGSRLHEAYFAHYPGMWRHGDWVKRTKRGTFVVYGRSDATLNRGGVRMGTAEFYRVVEAVDGVADSVVVDTTELGRDGKLVLLVVPDAAPARIADGSTDLVPAIRKALASQLSPRHVPDIVLEVAAIPRTLNNKRLEVPIRRILLGTPVADAVSLDALVDPSALEAVLETLRRAGLL